MGLPEHGIGAESAYRAVHDELALDDAVGPNFGSFATTQMDPFADKLIVENLGKNFVCASEYESVHRIHARTLGMMRRMLHAPDSSSGVGTATAGSSEAIQLALLAHKWSWKARRQQGGLSTDRPNVVFFADAHVCWDKFARYFDVEPRKIPVRRHASGYTHSADELLASVDENTVCVGAVVGTTYTGQYHPVARINEALVHRKHTHGADVPIHVDAASAGFILPFVDGSVVPPWDFRLEQVASVNVSGHKFGLVYPGLGWLLFRRSMDLPRELVFDAPYLGGPLQTYTLNFSRGSAMVVTQYYNFLKLGRAGYSGIVERCVALSASLGRALEESGYFEVVSDPTLPILCFRCRPSRGVDAHRFSKALRQRGWVVPAYAMPANVERDVVLRIVVHERFTRAMVDALLRDVLSVCATLTAPGRPASTPAPPRVPLAESGRSSARMRTAPVSPEPG